MRYLCDALPALWSKHSHPGESKGSVCVCGVAMLPDPVYCRYHLLLSIVLTQVHDELEDEFYDLFQAFFLNIVTKVANIIPTIFEVE